jgi:hypothetical protein
MTGMPRRPHQQFTLRLPPALHARLAAEAERDHRSMTGQALHILEQWLDHQEQERRRIAEERREHHAAEEPEEDREDDGGDPRPV